MLSVCQSFSFNLSGPSSLQRLDATRYLNAPRQCVQRLFTVLQGLFAKFVFADSTSYLRGRKLTIERTKALLREVPDSILSSSALHCRQLIANDRCLAFASTCQGLCRNVAATRFVTLSTALNLNVNPGKRLMNGS